MSQRARSVVSRFVRLTLAGWGRPQVEEVGGVRSLSFGGGVVQSAMRLAEPDALNLGYTRAMMGFLLFCSEPRDVLVIGLGGGSLSKFCFRHLPAARITSVEIDPEVIALRDRFGIPPDGERFQVVHADASVFLAAGDCEADVILLDGYDSHGLPDRLCTESFYADCWRALSEQGVLVVNLWGNDQHRGAYLRRLKRVFGGRVWWAKSCDSGNLIAFALKSERYYPQWARLVSRARALDRELDLGLAAIVNDLRERRDPDESTDT